MNLGRKEGRREGRTTSGLVSHGGNPEKMTFIDLKILPKEPSLLHSQTFDICQFYYKITNRIFKYMIYSIVLVLDFVLRGEPPFENLINANDPLLTRMHISTSAPQTAHGGVRVLSVRVRMAGDETHSQ